MGVGFVYVFLLLLQHINDVVMSMVEEMEEAMAGAGEMVTAGVETEEEMAETEASARLIVTSIVGHRKLIPLNKSSFRS